MGNYKIFKSEYLDEKGKCRSKSFYIKYKTKFLWWTYWKKVQHVECGWGDCVNTITKFKSRDEAADFIKDVLCKGVPRDRFIETEVEKIDCK